MKTPKNFYVNVYDKRDREYGVMTIGACVRRFARVAAAGEVARLRKHLRDRGDFVDFLVPDGTGLDVKTTAVRLASKNDDPEQALEEMLRRRFTTPKSKRR